MVRDLSSKALDELPIPNSVPTFGRIECDQVHVRGVCAACDSRKAKGRRG